MNKECSEIEKVVSLEKDHRSKKGVIGGRVQVLRTLIRNYYSYMRQKYTEYDFIRHCEAILDNMLVKYDYDIEKIIDKWGKVSPEIKYDLGVCAHCGYRPPFCGCAR